MGLLEQIKEFKKKNMSALMKVAIYTLILLILVSVTQTMKVT